MKKTVELSKQSKKEQKQYHARQRRSWEGLSPVTRFVPDRKRYDRKKLKSLDLKENHD